MESVGSLSLLMRPGHQVVNLPPVGGLSSRDEASEDVVGSNFSYFDQPMTGGAVVCIKGKGRTEGKGHSFGGDPVLMVLKVESGACRASCTGLMVYKLDPCKIP